MSQLDPTGFISEYGEKITLKSRSLGSRDAVTGWPLVTWTDSEIMMYIEQMSTKLMDAGGGKINEVRLKGYVVASVNQEDQAIVRGATYKVELQPEPFAVGGVVVYWGLVLLQVS